MFAELNKIATSRGLDPLSETTQPTERELNNFVSKLEADLGLSYTGPTLKMLGQRMEAIVATAFPPVNPESETEEIL